MESPKWRDNPLESMDVLSEFHANLPLRFRFLEHMWKCYPDDVARAKVKGSPKSLRVSHWGP